MQSNRAEGTTSTTIASSVAAPANRTPPMASSTAAPASRPSSSAAPARRLSSSATPSRTSFLATRQRKKPSRLKDYFFASGN